MAAIEGDWKACIPRESHLDFFDNRNWSWVEEIWRQFIANSQNTCPAPVLSDEPATPTTTLHRVIQGDPPYSVTNLTPIHGVGLQEYRSSDPRYRRKTWAMRIGYLGSQYHGYQKQHSSGEATVPTVEDDLQQALGHTIVAAGRTDRFVSAVFL